MEYKSETKICQNCKKDFVIESEDFNFYEKIKIPSPTFCPECRLIRRLMWRNEHSLFRRPNAEEGKKDLIISVYHPDAQIKTYEKEMWWSDRWDSTNYGRDYDFSRPFFEQFKELVEEVPHIALSDSKSINSRFCNITVEMKNYYLVTAAWACEDSMYCNRVSDCKFNHDSYICYSTEFGHENVYCRDSNRLFFSLESEACLNSYFLYDCRNCSDCILCTNLRNKNYCIENVQYTKEEYETLVSKIKQHMIDIPFIDKNGRVYRRFELPLPSIHPDERHNRRLKLRNPIVLGKRRCFLGNEEIITTYLPESKGGPKKVLCSEHYKKEIY
jgi:hypothetical protein